MDFNSVLLPYGDQWRLHRRFFHQAFRADSVARFAPMQQQKSFQLLRRLLEGPSQFPEHIFEYVVARQLFIEENDNVVPDRYTASIVMNAVYEYDPVSRKDPMVEIVEKVINVILDALRPDVSIIIGAFPGRKRVRDTFTAHDTFGFSSLSSVVATWDVVQKDRRFVEDMGQGLCRNAVQLLVAKDGMIDGKPRESITYPGMQKSGSAGPSMIGDSLRKAEDQGIPADSAWMRGLKEAAATAFMGNCHSLAISSSISCFSQLHQKRCVGSMRSTTGNINYQVQSQIQLSWPSSS